MAKQTFTTGQVLTAAQMTSLQQTAMLGGAANAKVASYVLVAADAGDAITMSNASATTITVNTGLFAAGDIVTIINLGAGICTITAGTATIATSGSLALAQNQGGVLRFTSASESIFFQFATPASGDIEGVTAGTGISGGGTSGTVTVTNSMATAIDAKGDLIAGTGADAFARLGVGANDTVLTADSTAATGLKWATPAAGGMTLLSTTTLSGATTTISGISGSYKSLVAYIYGVTNATAVGTFRCAPNNNPSFTNSTIYKSLTLVAFSNNYLFLSSNATSTGQPDNGDADNAWTLTIDNYASAATAKNFQVYGGFANGYGQYGFTGTGRIISTAAITSLVFSNSGGNLSTGTVLLYGVN